MESIVKAIEEISSPVAIHTHNTPDPDALACCVALQWLFKKRSIESHIYYSGEISHPMNKTMVNYLNINVGRFDEYDSDNYEYEIVVDATESNAECTKPYLVIDHHKTKSKATHQIIEQIGAASTLVYEVLEQMNIEFESEDDQSVATALYIGIKTDTNDLLSELTTERDHAAWMKLLPFIDKKKLQGIIEYPLPAYFYELEYELQQEGNNKIEGSCWVGSVGIITKSKRDALPILAEKMLRREGIETTVVIAVVGDVLDASVRSINASLNVDQFCKKIFTKEHSGGKLGSGGTKSPLGVCSLEVDGKALPDDIRNKVWNGLKEGLFYKILHIATGN